jgi:5-methylcytosine-specific restriction endonuclease McrA
VKTYAEKLRDPRWQKKRLAILERDEFRCRDCCADDKTLHVHHCLYIAGKEPWDYFDEELRTLCEDCHEKRQSLEHDVVLEFKRFIAEKNPAELNDIMCCLLTGIAFVSVYPPE